MILYNITCSVDPAIHEEWLQWMKDIHIGEAMATGCFIQYKMLKMLDGEHVQSITYAVQYLAPSMDAYIQYQKEYAPLLQSKTKERYGERVSAFRSLLELLHSSDTVVYND